MTNFNVNLFHLELRQPDNAGGRKRLHESGDNAPEPKRYKNETDQTISTLFVTKRASDDVLPLSPVLKPVQAQLLQDGFTLDPAA